LRITLPWHRPRNCQSSFEQPNRAHKPLALWPQRQGVWVAGCPLSMKSRGTPRRCESNRIAWVPKNTTQLCTIDSGPQPPCPVARKDRGFGWRDELYFRGFGWRDTGGLTGGCLLAHMKCSPGQGVWVAGRQKERGNRWRVAEKSGGLGGGSVFGGLRSQSHPLRLWITRSFIRLLERVVGGLGGGSIFYIFDFKSKNG
jgi:hypothetical protein